MPNIWDLAPAHETAADRRPVSPPPQAAWIVMSFRIRHTHTIAHRAWREVDRHCARRLGGLTVEAPAVLDVRRGGRFVGCSSAWFAKLLGLAAAPILPAADVRPEGAPGARAAGQSGRGPRGEAPAWGARETLGRFLENWRWRLSFLKTMFLKTW